MTKKKVAASAPVVAPNQNNDYTQADWNGHALYQCKHCPVDYLDDEEGMRAHIRWAHPYAVEGPIDEPEPTPEAAEPVEEEEQCLEQL